MFSSIAFAAVAIISILPIGMADDTVTLYMPLSNGDPLPDFQDFKASILGTNSNLRTYSLFCASTDHCPLPPAFTLTEGPDLIRYTLTEAGGRFPATTTLSCTYSSGSGQCEGIVTATDADAEALLPGGQLVFAYAGLKPFTATVVAGQSYLQQDLQPASPQTTAMVGPTTGSGTVVVAASSAPSRSMLVGGSAVTASPLSAGAGPTGVVVLGGVLAGAVAAMAVAL